MTRKFIAMADLHIRGNTPEMRKDDYTKAQWQKLKNVVRYANKNDYPLIVVAGDVFDSPNVSYSVLNKTADIINSFYGHWVFIYGQHDLIFHNYELRAGTPLATLAKLPNVYIAEADNQLVLNGMIIHGASWGINPPETECDLLLVHKLITRTSSNMTGAVTAREFLAHIKTEARLIISGDNHQTFRYKNLINPGSMMRMSINQTDHEPGFFIVDYDKGTAEKIKFHIKEDVWKEPEQTDEFRTSFISQLKNVNLKNPDFINNVAKARDRIKDKRLKKEIDEILKEIQK